MRRVDRLITHIRSITENDLVNSTTDIEDDEIIEYINEGQHRIQARILAQHPDVFVAETTIASVAEQEEYNLPDDCFLASKVTSVEYSTDGETFYKLSPGYLRNRQSNISGNPKYYIRRDKLNNDTGSILLSPKPSGTGQSIRIVYTQRIDEMDKRRGIVSAVTLDSATSTVTSLTLDVSGNPPIDSTSLDNHDFITVVDGIGGIKMRNIRFDSVDTGSGVVTVNSTYSYDTGETLSVGDYIVGGKDTSTHSKLPRNIERYLIQFAAFKLLKRDSSVDSAEQQQELGLIESDILASYQEIQEDIAIIPIIEPWDDFGSY